jgi:hypothetical protein
MAEIEIDFEWPVAAGYGLREEAPRKQRPKAERLSTILGDFIEAEGTSLFVVAKRPQVRMTRPLDRFPGLYKALAKVGSPDDVLDFVTKFGPLVLPPGNDGLTAPSHKQSVQSVIQFADDLRTFLRYVEGERSALPSLMDREHLRLAPMEAALVIDPISGAPRMRFVPKSLVGAIWIQLGQILAGGARVRSCAHCGNWFEHGPTTTRRLDSRFCSDEHRIASNSLRRSQPAAPQLTDKKRGSK